MKTTLNFKVANDGFSGLYQINSKGPWRTERKTDSMLRNGSFQITEGGHVVGRWVQGTLGHFVRMTDENTKTVNAKTAFDHLL